MPTTQFPDVASHLRGWGLKVIEVSGWQTRSSNWSKTFAPRGIVCHHTAGPTAGGNYPSYNTILKGRTDLPGPLSQFGLGRDGTVYVFAGHRANHAGAGGPLIGIPKDSGNAYLWGIEAENDGRQAWPTVQLNAYYRLCAALCAYPKAKFAASQVIGHKEWAPTRKVDPHSINMADFRKRVASALAAGPSTAKESASTTGYPGPKPMRLFQQVAYQGYWFERSGGRKLTTTEQQFLNYYKASMRIIIKRLAPNIAIVPEWTWWSHVRAYQIATKLNLTGVPWPSTLQDLAKRAGYKYVA